MQVETNPSFDPHEKVVVFEDKATGLAGVIAVHSTHLGPAAGGHISKCGDREVRTALYEAASAMLLRSKTWCSVRAWGLKIAQRRGHKRAVVAVARKLASVMQAMWLDGTEFSFQAPDRLQPSATPKAA